MATVVNRTHDEPRPAPTRARTGLRLAMFASLLAIVMIGGDPMPAASDEDGPGLTISIQETVKGKLVSAFEPRYVVGGDLESAEDSVPAGDVAEVSIATNTTDWGLAVRFTLPEGGKPKLQNVAARCRLVDQEGVVISEQFIENGEVFLEGNGRRGHHILFLEVDGLLDAFGIERLTDPMVDVEGRLATGGM